MHMERSVKASRSTVALFFLVSYAATFAVCLTSYRLNAVQCTWIALVVAAMSSGIAWSWPRLRGPDEDQRILAPLVVLAMPTLFMIAVFWLSMIRVLPDIGATLPMFLVWVALGIAAGLSAWLVPRSLPPARARRLALWSAWGGVLVFIGGVVWMFTSPGRSLFDGIVEFFQRRF